MSIFWCLSLRYEIKLSLDYFFTAEQAELKPPPVPIFNHRQTVNHAGCLVDVVDHCTMVN